LINQRYIFGLFLLLFSLGCSNQFKLEKKAPLTFKESYYQEWVSGVKGGGSGVDVFLLLEESNINKNVQMKGLYFKQKYCKLELQGNNKYQGFIKTNENQTSNISDNFVAVKESEVEKILFFLKGDNAVISYIENNKQKYFKITLDKKQSQHLPM
tara:strand:- start:219 stop:683 length:465 start_codon:yes stop_codon:yes gene_type:complete